MKTDFLKLDLPAGTNVIGQLPSKLSDSDQREDFLQIQLANGYIVDVGHYGGEAFEVVVVLDDWDNKIAKATAKDALEIKAAVEKFASTYGQVEVDEEGPVDLTVELVSQIDIDHWTTKIVTGQWKDEMADVKMSATDLEQGQQVSGRLTLNKKHSKPSTAGYCGRFEVETKKVGTAKKAK